MKIPIGKILNTALGAFGYRLLKVQSWNAINVESRPRALIDVGCAQSTPEFYDRFPGIPILMIDPLHEYESEMRRISRGCGGAYELVALGQHVGYTEINVNLDRPVRSSIFPRTELTSTGHRYESRQVPVTTLDAVVGNHAFEPPFGLKIDAEGFELEVLKGATSTLAGCCLVIVETSVQARFEGSYRFEELVQFMSEQHFRISNVLSAETDGEGLVRYMDLLFVPNVNRG